MSDMRVKLFLDLVNRLKPKAQEAVRDLKGIQDAAKRLKGERGPDKITRDIERLAPASKQAGRGLREVKTAARDLRSQRGPERLTSDLDRARSAATRLKNELRATKAARVNFAKQSPLADLNTAEGRVPGGGSGAGAAMLAAGRRALAPVAGAYLGYQGVRAGVGATVGKSISAEKSMAEVAKKVDLPEGETLQGLERTIEKLAISYGRSFGDVAAIVAEAGAAGTAFNELAGFTTLATKAAIAWDVPAREAAQKLFEIRAATQGTLPELEEFTDMINALGDNSAAKESSILEMFQRAGAAAKEAGVPIKTSLAFLTGIRSVGIGEEVGARAFGALTNKLVTVDRSAKGTKALKELGLDAKVFAKRMRTDATGALLQFFEALEKSPDAIGPLTDFVGNEWFDEVLRMKGAVKEVLKQYALLADPARYKGSSNKAVNFELATTENHLKRLDELASKVGRGLGRWALPPIKEAVERILAGFDELDRRAAEAKKAEDLGKRRAEGKPLTPEERERMARDPAFEREVGKAEIEETREIGRSLDPKLGDKVPALQSREKLVAEQRLEQSEAELAKVEREMTTIRGRSRNADAATMLLAPLRTRQAMLRRDVEEMRAFLERASTFDPRRPADQDDRVGDTIQRSAVLGLQARIAHLEAQLRRLDTLTDTSGNPADREGYRADRRVVRQRRAKAEGQLRREQAPAATTAGNFGFGPGGAPANAQPSPPTPGVPSFGITGGGKTQTAEWKTQTAAWAQKFLSDFDIDLGPAGQTMMERLTAGIRTGGGTALSAALQVNNGVSKQFAADLSGAGSAMMSSLAAGIRAGGNEAVKEAQAVANRVKAATAGGTGGGGATPRPIGGALHDGVD